MRRKQNDDCNVWNFRRCLFGMSSVVPTVKPTFLQKLQTLLQILNRSKWILVIGILNQILLTLLHFIALQILWMVAICCARLLFGVYYYVKVQFTFRRVIDGSLMVSKIWVGKLGMSTNNIHLLPIKIQGHLQNKRLWMPVYQNSFRRQKSKICTILVAILLFYSSKFFN